MHWQVKLPISYARNLLIRAIGFVCILSVSAVEVRSQFEMPSASNPAQSQSSELARSPSMRTSASQEIGSGAGSTSVVNRGVGESGTAETIPFQISGSQFRAMKYFVTGGCVALILVLLGSMVRLSSSDSASSDRSHAAVASSYPPGHFLPHPWTAHSYPESVGPEREPSPSSESSHDPRPATSTSGAVRPVAQPAFAWPMGYMPAMPIGVPVVWNPPQMPTTPAVSEQSSSTTAQELDGEDVQANESSVIQPIEESPSVEDMVMQKILGGAEPELGEDRYINEPDELTVECSDADVIRDLIAEDLANLPVETYGEDVDGSSTDSLELDLNLDAVPNAGSLQVSRADQATDVEVSSNESSARDDQSEDCIVDKPTNKSLFDLIIANTVNVKSLAS